MSDPTVNSDLLGFSTALPGEAGRPVLPFLGRFYEPAVRLTFINAGDRLDVRRVPGRKDLDRVQVSKGGTAAWETWEATDT